MKLDDRVLLKALISRTPVPIQTVESLPNNMGALYDHDQQVIFVCKGMGAEDIFRSVSKELAHAEIAGMSDNIALNKISGEWDTDKLSLLIADLQGADFDVSLTGFEAAEIDDLFAATTKKEGKDDKFDLNAALEKASFVERGDMWFVGRHRLYCADATSEEDVATLMDGKRANLVLTDPPYGVSFKSSTGLTIKNDSIKDEEFYEFLHK